MATAAKAGIAEKSAAQAPVDKPRILRWRGVLAGMNRTPRVVTALVLAVACAALSFTQLGFAGVGMSGEYAAYAVVLLIPVALGALLLGTVPGALMGVFGGGMLYTHALVMPLDFYELSFVTPMTSIVMLGIAGLLLGLLFAFALRNDPGRVKRVIYILIVCGVVSWLYSIGFVANVIVEVISNLATDMQMDATEAQMTQAVQESAASIALRLGSVSLQARVDALLMAVFCLIGDVAAKRARRISGAMGLRGMFAAWLAVVVFVAFMVTSGASFAAVTKGEVDEASRDMDDEVSYICDQLERADDRFDSIISVMSGAGLDFADLTDNQTDELLQSISVDTVLDGYSSEVDGTILVLASLPTEGAEGELDWSQDYFIMVSDDERFAVGKSMSELVDSEVISAINASKQSSKLERAIYDEGYTSSLEMLQASNDHMIRSEIVYILAREVNGNTVVMMLPASKVFAGRADVMIWTAISAFVLLAAVFGMMFLLLSLLVVRRIDETNGVLERITGGDLDARVDVRETREFTELSDGVNETVGALKGWIAEAETRMDAELATAKEIQEAALPRIFPPFPDILKFDVYATMNAAKEVGGDFYDFFLIGDADPSEGKLGFVIADVSGKGVPAALFMMKAKTQLRDYLASGMEVGEAVENANRQLCDGNDAGMFVTAWVGVLDYATGHIDFVNAGHNPPLLWREADGWRWMQEKSGMPLGLFDGFGYEAFSVDCGVGDELLLYTDGVTEAMNPEGELYGESRLERLVNDNYTLHPRMLVGAVRRDVAAWAKGAEQSDDITILALEVGVPPEVTAILTVPADVDELPRVNEFIHAELDRRLCPVRVQNQIDIAVEELFVNVAHYAYPEATPSEPGMVRVSYTYSAEPPSIKVQIIDGGIPYDPLAKPDAVTPDDIMDVPIGGLGILMAKRSVDEMTYERVDGDNVVTIVKRW